jgi:hypothetical protein
MSHIGGPARQVYMRGNSPSISDVLSEIAGRAFVLGFLTMAAAPFALPALAFGLLMLPLLLPVLIVGLLYGMVALPRRYLAARKLRPKSSVRSKQLVTHRSYS